MQLVSPVNLLPPSICHICEGQPDGEAVVDTLYNFKPGVASVLNGRKYVCERCVGEFAKLFGYEIGNDVQRAQLDRDNANRRVAAIRQRVDELAKALGDVINSDAIERGSVIDFDAVFQPPALDVVRQEQADRLAIIRDTSTEDEPKVAKPAQRKRTERPAVPAPGLEVSEGAAVETVPEATVEAADNKESNGSSGSESES